MSSNILLGAVAIKVKILVLALRKLRILWGRWTSRQVPSRDDDHEVHGTELKHPPLPADREVMFSPGGISEPFERTYRS